VERKKFTSLGISIAIHTLVFGIFLFCWINNEPKKTSEPLKIHISSMITPATPAPQLPIPKVVAPQKEIPKPIQKTMPVPPQAVPKPIPSKIATPAVAIPVVSRPAPPSSPQPIVQTPKTIETPKAPPAPPPPPVNVEKEFLNAHLGEIRSLLLQNMKYPKNAQRLKMQGEVRVSFSLGTDGSVDDVKVVEGSGFEILDEDAVALIQKTASKFPKPSKSVRISVPISYVLR